MGAENSNRDLVAAIEGAAGGRGSMAMDQLKGEAFADIPSSPLSIDTSLPLPQLSSRVM